MRFSRCLFYGWVFILLLAGCAPPGLPGSVQDAGESAVTGEVVTPAGTAEAPSSPTPGTTPLPTDTPQPSPTPTPAEPVFDPAKVVDVASLGDYQLLNERRAFYTGEDGQSVELNTDLHVEYQADPEMVYVASVTGSELGPDGEIVPSYTDDYYLVGDLFYGQTEIGWFIRVVSAASNQRTMKYTLRQYGFGGYLNDLESAQFAGVETLDGVPVLHFTFTEDDLAPDPWFDDSWENLRVEGDLYLSQEGSYPVRYEESSSADVRPGSALAQNPNTDYVRSEIELVVELVSMEPGRGISLPGDAPQVDRVVDVPLPPDAELSSVMVLTDGGTTYTYATPMTVQETLAYYQGLASYPPGWQFSQVISTSPNGGDVHLFKDGILEFLYVRFNQFSGWTEIDVR